MPPPKVKRKTGSVFFLALSTLGVFISFVLTYIDPEEFPHVVSTDFLIFLFVSILSGLSLLEPKVKGHLQTLSAALQAGFITALIFVAFYNESPTVRSWIRSLIAHPRPLETAIGTTAVLLVIYGFVKLENRFPTPCAIVETMGVLLFVGYAVFRVINRPEAETCFELLAAALALVIPLRHFGTHKPTAAKAAD